MSKIPISVWWDVWWWRYLLAPPSHYARGWRSDNRLVDWFYRIRCRLRGHPEGTVYYNPGALEPDTHCKGCGDDLG